MENMRYYGFAAKASVEKIKNLLQAKDSLLEFRWERPVLAVNSCMYQNLKNDVGFLAYRQEDDMIYAAMFFDERRENLESK